MKIATAYVVQVNLFTKQKQTHLENKFMVTKGKR